MYNKIRLKILLPVIIIMATVSSCDWWEPPVIESQNYTVSGRLLDATGSYQISGYRLQLVNHKKDLTTGFVELISETTTDENGNFRFEYAAVSRVDGSLRIGQAPGQTPIRGSFIRGIPANSNFDRDIVLEPFGLMDILIENISDLGASDTVYIYCHPSKPGVHKIDYKGDQIPGFKITKSSSLTDLNNLRIMWNGNLNEPNGEFIKWGVGHAQFVEAMNSLTERTINFKVKGFPAVNTVTVDLTQ